MKQVIVSLLVLNTAFSSAAFFRQRLRRSTNANSSDVETKIYIEQFNFEQRLDHFKFENTQKWDQRYWVSRSHYKTGGPAFLLVNGEWAVNGDSEFNDSWVSYAKNLGAMCFSLEHRFYGESWPENGNFHYLSTSQALSDIANFIKGATEKFQLPKDTKWILFGCSYAGILAAWARLKYPHLVYGTVASSAPLLCKTDYDDYLQNIENAIKSYDPKCLESITQTTKEIDRLINNTENVTNISTMFQYDINTRDLRYVPSLCNEKDIVEIAKNLFGDLVNILTNTAQANSTTGINIPTVCDIMMNHNGTKLEAFEKLRQMYFKSIEDDDSDESADRSYSYQVCSEIGGFFSYNKTESFSILSHLSPIENDLKENCEPFFGPKFGINEMNEKMDHANLLYGGLDFNVGNTLFIQGSIDPWHTSGIYEKKNGSLYETIFINGTSHCSDYYKASDQDIPELKKAREETLKILKKWLKT